MVDISLSDVSIVYGGNVLIESSKLHLAVGKRYGLIGVRFSSVCVCA